MKNSTSLHLKTEHLDLIPYTQQVAQAAMTDKSQVEQLLEVRVPSDWPWSHMQEVLPFIAQLAADPLQLGWGAWLMIHRGDGAIIGDLGFAGKPDESGTVVIGYNVLPAYQNQGYGFEAVQALVNWAFTQPNLKRIVADCYDNNPASMRILEKLGMQPLEIVEVLDMPSVKLWKWELKL